MTFEAKFIDITNWDELFHVNTGGTRDKMVVTDQKGEYHFFKGSKTSKDKSILYPQEFWSEIITSKIGAYLGFNLLDYNIGYKKEGLQEIGCISKTMIESDSYKLTEGKSYLSGADPNYRIKDQHKYTFQFIVKALEFSNTEHFIPEIIKIIIFDAIISNGDRHQENWAIILKGKKESSGFKKVELKYKNIVANALKKNFMEWYNINKEKRHIKKNKRSGGAKDKSITTFAPIYDSGSSLAREITNESVNKMLANDAMINKYIKRGPAEIRWEGEPKKISHFELIKKIKGLKEYEKIVSDEIKRIESIWKEQEMISILESIDTNLPPDLSNHKLSEARKKLIIKLITLRLNKLLNI